MGVGHVSSHCVIFLQHWRKLAKHEGEPWPVGRDGHAAVCLGPEHLLVIGGYCSGYLNDAWILNVSSGKWKEVSSTLIYYALKMCVSKNDHFLVNSQCY